MDETNFVTVEAPALIGVGVQSIVEQAKQLGLTWTFQPGTVGTGNSTNGISVTFDGDTAAINCVNVSDVDFGIGARVMGIITPTGNYIIGGLGAKRSPVSNLSLESFAPALSTTSLVYVTIPGAATGTFVKKFSETAIKVSMNLTYYATGAGASMEFGVLINGVDYTITRLITLNSSLNSHTTVSGIRKVAAGLAAGSYPVVARARLQAAGGTANMDSGDNILVYLEEVEA